MYSYLHVQQCTMSQFGSFKEIRGHVFSKVFLELNFLSYCDAATLGIISRDIDNVANRSAVLARLSVLVSV
jgi:hypothetical protein